MIRLFLKASYLSQWKIQTSRLFIPLVFQELDILWWSLYLSNCMLDFRITFLLLQVQKSHSQLRFYHNLLLEFWHLVLVTRVLTQSYSLARNEF